MSRQSLLRIFALAMAWVCALGIANAIPVTSDVTLESQSGDEATLISAATAPKARDAETMAVKQAFFALIERGVDGLHAGQPMATQPNKAFNYTFYKENKYLSCLTCSPVKLDESKIGNEKRVRVKVTVNLNKLKKDLEAARFTISPAWQDKSAAAPAASLHPTIVVVPYIPAGEDDSFEGMKAYLDSLPALRHAVNAVSSQFSAHGYKTLDFITMESNSRTDDIMMEGTQTDAQTVVIQQLPADIAVRVQADLATEGKKGQCSVTVDAVERQTAGKLCSATFSSGQYMTTDATALTDHAVRKIEKQFFNRLEDAFSQMIEQGRGIKLEFLLSETVSDWDFDTETPATEADFKEELEEWLRRTAQHGVYDMSQHNDKFIAASINIPLWDMERDRSYSIGNFNSALRKFLRQHLGDAYKAKVSAMGQKLIITIE